MGDLVKKTLKRIIEAEDEAKVLSISPTPPSGAIGEGLRTSSENLLLHVLYGVQQGNTDPESLLKYLQDEADYWGFHDVYDVREYVENAIEFGELEGKDDDFRLAPGGEETLREAGLSKKAKPKRRKGGKKEDSELQIYSTEPPGAMGEEGELRVDDQEMLADLEKETQELMNLMRSVRTKGPVMLQAVAEKLEELTGTFSYAAGHLGPEAPGGPVALGPKVVGDVDFTTPEEGGPTEEMGDEEPMGLPEPEPTVGGGAAESVARAFHETYERLASEYDYETREESAKPWEEVPEENRNLMIAVVSELLEKGVIEAGTPEEPPIEPEVEIPPPGEIEEV